MKDSYKGTNIYEKRELTIKICVNLAEIVSTDKFIKPCVPLGLCKIYVCFLTPIQYFRGTVSMLELQRGKCCLEMPGASRVQTDRSESNAIAVSHHFEM